LHNLFGNLVGHDPILAILDISLQGTDPHLSAVEALG
jgi:hypothetical protein